MATDHRGRIVGNPDTAHGGHSRTPEFYKARKNELRSQVQLGKTDYLEYNPMDNSYGVKWDSGDYESQPAENLVYSDGPRAGLPLDIEHLKELHESSHPDNMFAVRHADVAFKPYGTNIVVPDPYGEDVPTDTLGRY
jgi:hypothetical protein